jgi:hypothetical protein
MPVVRGFVEERRDRVLLVRGEAMFEGWHSCLADVELVTDLAAVEPLAGVEVRADASVGVRCGQGMAAPAAGGAKDATASGCQVVVVPAAGKEDSANGWREH